MSLPERPLQPGPTRTQCPCGCAVFSVLKKNGHVRGCPCAKCRGGRNRQAGLKKQRIARRRAGVPDAKFHGQLGNEENWNGEWRVEVKSGKQANPVATRFLLSETQASLAKAFGDPRPFMAIFMPEGWGNEGLVVVRLSDWERGAR